MKRQSTFLFSVLSVAVLSGCQNSNVLQIEKQGSFSVGGSYVTHKGTFKQENFISPNGQRAYGDFAYVKYQTPVNAKKYPLIFQHGGAQSSHTWESTVDGREGFDSLFVRKGYSVYLVDQPRSGKSNLSTKAVTPDTPWASNPMYGDKTLWILSRMGSYDSNGNPIANAQFPQGESAYQAFQQSWTIGSGPLDNDLNADVLAKLVDQTDGAVLVTHSMGAQSAGGRFYVPIKSKALWRGNRAARRLSSLKTRCRKSLKPVLKP
ncbi:hypothetical protein [Actinobacillus suis]|uniref:hypothetical protein n=1 Tax=Actinobacillus suis TaxID=716 RepID=UPI00207C9566|nr:hypothetical protein [Actinobacillus suis]